MSRFLYLCVALSVLSLCSARSVRPTLYQRTVRYDGEILVRCPVGVPSVKPFLKNDDVDVWRITADGEADIRVTQSVFQSTGMDKYCTKISDIESLVQRAENYTFTGAKQEWFEEYHRYDDIVQWYQELATNNPDLVTYVQSIGLSFEGRNQPAVRITASAGNKATIYFQCQIHAREWISGATCMYIANYLVENADSEQVRAILDLVEFVFVPFVNPDGYEYTWTNDRLWRKNRQINSGSTCRGVDLNRNYNDHWNEGGSSGNPCSETYHGASAESEPETQNTARYFRSFNKIVGAIDWHSYSQLILRPYGWTSNDSPDEARLKEVGDRMRDLIQEVHGKTYTSQKSIGLYPTSGTASDWFYSDNANVNNEHRAAGYTIELRDTGQYGFLLPPSEIIPQGEEMVDAVLYFAGTFAGTPLDK